MVQFDLAFSLDCNMTELVIEVLNCCRDSLIPQSSRGLKVKLRHEQQYSASPASCLSNARLSQGNSLLKGFGYGIHKNCPTALSLVVSAKIILEEKVQK